MRPALQRGTLGLGVGPCFPWLPGRVVCGGRCQALPSCAHSLVTDFPQGVRECREPELGLEELLRHRCQLLQQHEEYQVGRPLPAPRSVLHAVLVHSRPPSLCSQHHGHRRSD